MQTRIELQSSMGQFLSGFRAPLNRLERAVAEWAMIDDYQAVLDLSCVREHLLSHYLAHYELRACGLCFDASVSRKMRNDLEHAEIMYTMGPDIPWQSGSFDRILLSAELPGYISGDDLLGEAYRVLKPGGKLIAAVGALFANSGFHPFQRNADMSLEYLKKMENIGFVNVSYHQARLGSRCLLAGKPESCAV